MQEGSTAASGDSPSSRLGKYQLIRRLASGGMAEIFLARAQAIHGFEKIVVLKRILPQHSESEDFIRMFLAEARLAATLHHPTVVQVYDIGEESGTYFFTMEYIQGQDIRRLVRAERRKTMPIPLEHILNVVMGMAGGLHHAHEKVGADGEPLGIVHRDVSPSNVLVTYDGDVKVVDFGIAKAAAAQVSTIAGTLKGKIPYMSPEQCRGEAVDRRSDIFSIGTLLWELTTGKRLFGGENEFAILNRVAKADVPPPSSIQPDYPPELEAIVLKALAQTPHERYATAIDLQLDLEDFARDARLPVSPARMGRFMRELFDDEIRVVEAELREVRASSEPSGTIVVSPSSPPEGISDLTPSEVRLHSQPTPGLVQDDVASNTNISLWGEDGPTRRGPFGAIAAGFALTLAIGGGVWALSERDKQPAPPTVAPQANNDKPAKTAPRVAEPPGDPPTKQPGGDIAVVEPPAAEDTGDAKDDEPESGSSPEPKTRPGKKRPRRNNKPSVKTRPVKSPPKEEDPPPKPPPKKAKYDEDNPVLPI